MAINDFRAIETFTKAVELGSIRKAAVAQGVSPQAASQALALLEQRIGARLLHRTTRSIALTDEGRQFLEAAQPAIAALERAVERVRSAKDDIAGSLRIAAPRSSFLPVLWPVVDSFCQQYPQIHPDLHLDDRIGNWVQDRVDVGFRIGSSPEDGLIARQLFKVQLIVCAAPAYLSAHGAPASIEQLASHRCSVFRHPGDGHVFPWSLKVDGEIVSRSLTPFLSTNDVEVETQAVLAGHVIGLLSGLSAAEHIRAGRLVPLLIEHMTDNLNVNLYYGSRTAQPSRVRAFIDHAVKQLASSPEFVLSDHELQTAAAAGKQLLG